MHSYRSQTGQQQDGGFGRWALKSSGRGFKLGMGHFSEWRHFF